jgi:NAD-dependent SIR2 family protein deacetylase
MTAGPVQQVRPATQADAAQPDATQTDATQTDATQAHAAPSADVEALAAAVAGGGVVVLSGAGISTESGIPDYRGPTGIARGATPMTYQEFVGSEQARQRYWARSFAGWPVIRRARPNAGHLAVARLQAYGLVEAVITQNVDGLHHAAGSDHAVELHGALDRVVCLACCRTTDRGILQQRLTLANPGFDPSLFTNADGDTASVRPDGDVVLAEAMVHGFGVVDCRGCGQGPLKPDVVFFGESVPKPRVAECYRLVDDARLLLVLGSSLTVMSGYRFVRHAAKRGIGVAIVNQGPTRGDEQATLRIDAPLGAVLTAIADALTPPSPPSWQPRSS